MSSLPPKTIEKFGVIVKKPDAAKKTSEEGLMPVPTRISAEDELREQKSNAEKYRTGELKVPRQKEYCGRRYTAKSDSLTALRKRISLKQSMNMTGRNRAFGQAKKKAKKLQIVTGV